MISCISFSQTLTPTVQLLNKDTIFCFSISQSKEIAKRIQAGSWCDSILQVQQRWMQLYDQSTGVNDSIVLQLKQKVNNMKALTQNQRVSISLLNKTINLQKKQLKRSMYDGRFYAILAD